MKDGKLPVATKLGFGVCDLGGNLFFTAMGFWSLNYLTDTVAVPAAAAGVAIMVGKFWDAVTDPMMGFISDRTRSRWGRRRPYLLFGAIPLLLSMWWFFSAPKIADGTLAAIWAALALCVLNTAYTVVNIPYSALTPELTKDYNERTSLNGYRFSFAVIGTILGAAAVQPIIAAAGSSQAGFSLVGLVFGATMAATALLTFASVREPDHDKAEVSQDGFFRTYGSVFTHKPYLILLFVYAFNLTGITFVQTILVYYFKYIFGNEALTTIAMLLLLVTAALCVPISVLVAKRIGKKRTYQLALGIIAVACMVIFLFAHRLGPVFTLAVMTVSGIGIGFGYVPPFAMLPDAVEVDAKRRGKRREGAFYGIWTFTSKIGVALATSLAGVFLGLAGYVANAASQPESAILAIRLVIGPLPAAILLAGILLVERYPLDEKTYEAIMAE
ncbi:MAG: MFS transporter [Spirochaetes bacterium]|nr:MFS transporter [Spirochaetota bacterium]